MSQIAYYGILGIGPGAMIGLIALGLVLIYRGTGVLNFAHTTQAGLGAYLYAELASMSVPLWLALILAVIASGLSGVLVQLVVMRPLRSASPLTKLIASSGVLLIIQSILLLTFGSSVRNVASPLPATPVHLWGRFYVGSDNLLMIAVAVVVTVVLWLVYRYSTFGAVTSAVAENPIAGAALGRDPSRIAIGNWFLGGALAGLAGSLLAPISGLNLVEFLGLLVPVLAAALAGGFTSFPLTIVGGIVIGVAQAETTAYSSVQGASTIATFAILVIVMLLRGKAVPARGFIGTRMPSLGTGRIRWWLVVATLAVAMVLVWVLLPLDWNQALLTSMLVALPMLSVVVVTGYAGQLSLAQYAIAGLGAFIAAQIAESHHVPFLVLLLIGGAGSLPLGFVLALTARRMRGVSLGILTLGFNVLLFATLFSKNDVVTIPDPSIFGLDLTALLDPRRYLTVVIVIFAIFALGVANLRRGQSGRQLIAIRGNERAAASIGINVNGAKTTAFMIGAFIAAVGGVLIAFSSTAVSYSDFDTLSSISQLGWVVIGGVGYLAGPLVGMTFMTAGLGNQLIATLYNDQFSWLPLFGGIALTLTVLLNPDGITSVNIAMARKLAARRRKAASAEIKLPVPAAAHEPARARGALEVTGVSMSFGAVHALKDVSLTVHPGTVHGLIGPNGAGKTVLLDVISGFVRPQAGELALGDRSLSKMPAWRRSRQGIGRSFQSLELFDDLSVYDNIRAASEVHSRINVLRDVFWPRNVSLSPAGWEAVRLLELGDVLHRRIDELSYGKRHLVAIARALATDSDVILLDEPAAGLDESETAELRTLVRRIADQSGMAVLIIEHDVELVMSVSDMVTALNFGEVIAHGTPDEVGSHPAVIASYLGEEQAQPRDTVLTVAPEAGESL